MSEYAGTKRDARRAGMRALLLALVVSQTAAAQAPGKWPPDSLFNTHVIPRNTSSTNDEALGRLRTIWRPPEQNAAQSPRETSLLDFSGVDAFWRVYETLRLDREPAPASWDSLFATAGYAALEARERRRAAIQDAMRFGFMPSRAAGRDSVTRSGSFTARSLQHLRGVPAARDSIAAFRVLIAKSGFIEAARRSVAAYLPARLADTVPPPPIAFLFFLSDGRGYPTLVVADLLRLTRTGVDTGFFAHEYFHYYRRRFAAPAPSPAPGDVGLSELLAYPAEEGVADQLDKRRYVESDDAEFERLLKSGTVTAYAAGYRDAYRRAGESLARVSRALERAATSPDSANFIARSARDSLPDAGRALGAYMASTIDRRLGRDRLILAAADTYRFWLAYDEAASGTELPRLSRMALDVIRRLAE